MLVVRFRARAHIGGAFEWYRVRSPGAAADSLDAVDRALTHLAEVRARLPVVRGRLLLAGVPYAVYDKVQPRTISVVGVIHGHRHPDTWPERAVPERSLLLTATPW